MTNDPRIKAAARAINEAYRKMRPGVRFDKQTREALAIAALEAADAVAWRPISEAPRGGARFWGKVGDDAIAMLWHDKFDAFVSEWRRIQMASRYTIDGKSYSDHSPVIHEPTHFMRLPTPPESGDD